MLSKYYKLKQLHELGKIDCISSLIQKMKENIDYSGTQYELNIKTIVYYIYSIGFQTIY